MLDDTRSKPIQLENCVSCVLLKQRGLNKMFLYRTSLVKPIHHFLQNSIFAMLDEILDQFNKVLRSSVICNPYKWFTRRLIFYPPASGDTSIFSVVYDIYASAKEPNEDLNEINNWEFQWKMHLNPWLQ